MKPTIATEPSCATDLGMTRPDQKQFTTFPAAARVLGPVHSIITTSALQQQQ
jgi:hypothetical protein